MTTATDSLVRGSFDRGQTVGTADGRLLVGYPIVFDRWTTINSHEGSFKERIAPGALDRTLREDREYIKVLFNHGADPSIGDKPLGKPSVMNVDKRGLYVECPLSQTAFNDDLIELIRDGAIDGMSFRFSVDSEEWNRDRKERTITALTLYEFGPVTFAAYQATMVAIRENGGKFGDELKQILRKRGRALVDLGRQERLAEIREIQQQLAEHRATRIKAAATRYVRKWRAQETVKAGRELLGSWTPRPKTDDEVFDVYGNPVGR